MKKIITMIILGMMLLTLLGLSWEGEVDPTELWKWNVLYGVESKQSGCYLVFVKNPDKTSFVEKVSLWICNEKLVRYRYFKFGEAYVFEYNERKDGYYKQNLGKERKRRCFGCHPEQRSRVPVKEIDI